MLFSEFASKPDVHVFCDMDGVLTDWHGHFVETFGKDIDEFGPKRFDITKELPSEWWVEMPWKDDGQELWEYLTKNFDSLHILSAPTQDVEEKCEAGKRIWLKQKGVTQQITEERCIINSEKHKFIKESGVSILIDDREKKINKWKEAGGKGVLHTSTKDTIRQLQEIIRGL